MAIDSTMERVLGRVFPKASSENRTRTPRVVAPPSQPQAAPQEVVKDEFFENFKRRGAKPRQGVVERSGEMPLVLPREEFKRKEPSLWNKVYNYALVRPFFALTKAVKTYERWVQDPLLGMITQDEDMRETQAAVNSNKDFFSNWIAWGDAFDASENITEGSKLVMRMVADPLNLVGWGLFGKIPGVAGRVLGKIDWAFIKASEAPFVPFKLALKGAKKVGVTGALGRLVPPSLVKEKNVMSTFFSAKSRGRHAFSKFSDNPNAYYNGGPEYTQALVGEVLTTKKFSRAKAPVQMFNDVLIEASLPDVAWLAKHPVVVGLAGEKNVNQVLYNIMDVMDKHLKGVALYDTVGDAQGHVLNAIGVGVDGAEKLAKDVVKRTIKKRFNIANGLVDSLLTPKQATEELARRASLNKGTMAMLDHMGDKAGKLAAVLNGLDWVESSLFRNGIDRFITRPLAQSYLSFGFYGVMNNFEEMFRSLLATGSFPGMKSADRALFEYGDLLNYPQSLLEGGTEGTTLSLLGRGGAVLGESNVDFTKNWLRSTVAFQAQVRGWDDATKELAIKRGMVAIEKASKRGLIEIGPFSMGDSKSLKKLSTILGDRPVFDDVDKFSLISIHPLSDPDKVGAYTLDIGGVLGSLTGKSSRILSAQSVRFRRHAWGVLYEKEYNRLLKEVPNIGEVIAPIDDVLEGILKSPVISTGMKKKDLDSIVKSLRGAAMSEGKTPSRLIDKLSYESVADRDVEKMLARYDLLPAEVKQQVRVLAAGHGGVPLEKVAPVGVAPPAVVEPFNLGIDELDELIAKESLSDKAIVDEVFGKEMAKKYNRLQRTANTSLDTAKADAASVEILRMESRLSDSQKNRLFGVAGVGFDVDELKAIRSGLSRLDYDSPEALGRSLGDALLKAPKHLDTTKMTNVELVAYSQLNQGFKEASKRGFDVSIVSKEAMEKAASRFPDPEDAKFMLEQFLKPKAKVLAPVRAAPSVVDFTEELAPIVEKINANRKARGGPAIYVERRLQELEQQGFDVAPALEKFYKYDKMQLGDFNYVQAEFTSARDVAWGEFVDSLNRMTKAQAVVAPPLVVDPEMHLIDRLSKYMSDNALDVAEKAYVLHPAAMAQRLGEMRRTFESLEFRSAGDVVGALNNFDALAFTSGLMPHEMRRVAYGAAKKATKEADIDLIWQTVDGQIGDYQQVLKETLAGISRKIEVEAERFGVTGVGDSTRIAEEIAEAVRDANAKAQKFRVDHFKTRGTKAKSEFWAEYYSGMDEIWLPYHSAQAGRTGRLTGTLARVANGGNPNIIPPIDLSTLSIEKLATALGGNSDQLARSTIEHMGFLQEDSFVEYVKNYLAAAGLDTRGTVSEDGLRLIHQQLLAERGMDSLTNTLMAPVRQQIESTIADIKTLRVKANISRKATVELKERVTELDRVVKELREGNVETWKKTNDLREMAAENVTRDMPKNFTPYDDPSYSTMVMKHFYPFWTYEWDRWGNWLPRQLIAHPWMTTQLGRWLGNTDYGYVKASDGSQINPLRGTIFGTTATLTKLDFKEAYSGETFEFFDQLQRRGFYLGGPGQVLLSTLGWLQSRHGEWGGLLPPMHDTLITLMVATGSEKAAQVQEKLFPTRFRDGQVNQKLETLYDTRLDDLEAELKERDALPDSGENTQRMDQIKGMINTARRSVAKYNWLATQTGMLRMRDKERSDLEELRSQLGSEVLGISEEEYINLTREGLNPFSVYSEKLTPVMWSLVMNSYPFKYAGINEPLMTYEPEASIMKEVDTANRKSEKSRNLRYDGLNELWGEFISNEQYSAKERRARAEEINSKHIARMQGLFGEKEWRDGQRVWKLDTNGDPITGDYGWVFKDGDYKSGIPRDYDELMQFYEWTGRLGSIAPQGFLDYLMERRVSINPYAEEYRLEDGSPDWDAFNKEIDRIDASVPEAEQTDWEIMLSRGLPVPEKVARELKKTVLAGYWDVWTKEFEKLEVGDRQKIRSAISSKDPMTRNVMKTTATYKIFTKEVRDRREQMRRADDELDYFLWFLGYTEKGVDGKLTPSLYSEWGKKPPMFGNPDTWATNLDDRRKEELKDWAQKLAFTAPMQK